MEQLLEALEQTRADVYGAKLTGAVCEGGRHAGGGLRAAARRVWHVPPAGLDGNAFDASLPQSWIEIRPDNTVLLPHR